MNIKKLNNPFYYEPHPLCVEAARSVIADVEKHEEWHDEVRNGKMFGVLVADDGTVLKAYSGQILGRGDWEEYVPAVFDYLDEGGYFKREEANIVGINNEIQRLETGIELQQATEKLAHVRSQADAAIAEYKAFVTECKVRRRTEQGGNEAERIREAQFQKAELHRMKVRYREEVAEAEAAVSAITARVSVLKQERKQRSDALQRWLFENFEMQNGFGQKRNLLDIFADWSAKRRIKCILPPSGSGECCAPKLLQYAFLHGMKPSVMAEFTLKEGEGWQPMFHGACQSRCAPILDWMLRGVDYEANALEADDDTNTLTVLYEDDKIIAVDKPAGMLSVPGKSSRRSAYDILRQMRPDCEHLMMAHRLDMQTSGVLVAAKDIDTYRYLQQAFTNHVATDDDTCLPSVKKEYVAVLDGVLPMAPGTKGEIRLPLSADYLNRPLQRVDYERGKPAHTIYEVLGTDKDGKHTVLRLMPITGRTHQLRLHCAHPDGLGMPILGDDLYGRHADRLHLYATKLQIDGLLIKIDDVAF